MQPRLPIVFAVTTLVSLAPAHAAEFIVDGTLPGGGDCPSVGEWLPDSATCRITDHVVEEGDTLRARNVTLEVAGTLTNLGTVDSEGRMVVDGLFDNRDTFVNDRTGTLVNRGEMPSWFMYNFGSFWNQPTATLEIGLHLQTNGPFLNEGSILIKDILINTEIFENRGDVEIAAGSELRNHRLVLNTGRMHNDGVVVNNDRFVQHCEGVYSGNPVGEEPMSHAQSLYLGGATLEWCAIEDAVSYDVVRGDVGTLHATGGDFSAATRACSGNDVEALSLSDPAVPQPASALWFTVRPNGVADSTYDSRFPSQAASRDDGIASSGLGCP